MVFSINSENSVRVLDALPSSDSPAPDGMLVFDSSKAFTHAGLEWPMARFVAIWDKLAPRVGLKPVQKFENRQIAMVRIWRAVEKLAEPPALGVLEAYGPEGAAAGVPTPSRTAARTKARKGVKSAKAGEPKAPREGTAKAKVIAMLERKGGVTLRQIQDATGWQPHTVRGFVSVLASKGGMTINSIRRESDKARVYEVAR